MERRLPAASRTTADEAELAVRKLAEVAGRAKQAAAAQKAAKERQGRGGEEGSGANPAQKGQQEARRDQARPADGATVTRQPQLIVRMMTRGIRQ